MAIISRIGRKAFKTRLLLYGIFATLCVGAFSMIYPFMLMISGTTKSAVDTPDAVPFPKFLYSDADLYKKDAEGYFNEALDLTKQIFNTDCTAFRDLLPPDKVNAKFAKEWVDFTKNEKCPFYFSELSYMHVPYSSGTMPLNLRRFKNKMSEKSGGDMNRLNAMLGTDFASWNNFIVIPEVFLQRNVLVQADPGEFKKAYRVFKSERPRNELFFISVPGFYRYNFAKAIYLTIENYNATHSTAYKSWDEILLPERFPENATPKEQEDWQNFVREFLNPVWVRTDEGAIDSYAEYLKEKYDTLLNMNKIYAADFPSFKDVPIFDGTVKNDIIASDYYAFIKGWNDPDTGKTHKLDKKFIRVDGIDYRFAAHLKAKFLTIGKLNSEFGTDFPSWERIVPPQRDAHFIALSNRKFSTRVEFVQRNFIAVFNYLFLHGRALLNTFIYCSLSILIALIVNPISAYALSRYRPPSTYKILLFMMLTMAFPPMVTQIPVFLLVRNFNLLNTYWALILPGLANGYAIFMLKGFFDSLPQELYESAQIDGASEIRIFWQITMSLSKPILAVIALNAFVGSYSNFMMALLICQDQKMWTIMPWLYQLGSSTQGVVFASLLVAAIPTLIVYSLCQNVIMRGIVVPVEK